MCKYSVKTGSSLHNYSVKTGHSESAAFPTCWLLLHRGAIRRGLKAAAAGSSSSRQLDRQLVVA